MKCHPLGEGSGYKGHFLHQATQMLRGYFWSIGSKRNIQPTARINVPAKHTEPAMPWMRINMEAAKFLLYF